MTLPGSRCKVLGTLQHPFYLPAATCSCPRHWQSHTVWCQPAASALPRCCVLPWLTDSHRSQTEKPPFPKGILCQPKGGISIRLHGLTDTDLPDSTTPPLPHLEKSNGTGLGCRGLTGLAHSSPCQHCHVMSCVLRPGSKRPPHSLLFTNPTAPTL